MPIDMAARLKGMAERNKRSLSKQIILMLELVEAALESSRRKK